MARITITFPRPVPRELAGDVTEKLAYASEHLGAFVLASDGASVEAELTGGDEEEVATKVRALVAAMIAGHRNAPPETIFAHRVSTPYNSPVWHEIVEAGLVASEGPGQIVLIGAACRLAEALDRAFTDIGTRVFEAEPHQYPTMIALDVLQRCEYFTSFPHHVTFAPHMREDFDVITDFAKAQKANDADVFRRNLAPPRHALSPAVCFHTYALLSGRTLESGRVVTARGRCFRYESKNFATLERVWDFAMREVIFVGAREWVDEMRARCIEEVKTLVTELGLDAWIETANDPFFATAFVAKRYHQLMTRAKYELRLGLPDARDANRSLAAASFNVHGDFFGRSLAIEAAGAPAFTGCLAFGVERWVWALFSQLGPKLDRWPEAVRRRLAV